MEKIYSEYFGCDCFSSEHLVRFVYFPSDKTSSESDELYVETHLTTYLGFFKRLWVGIKYAFGYKSRYGNWDSFSINRETAERMKLVIDKFLSESK